jgi:hypothetical protein
MSTPPKLPEILEKMADVVLAHKPKPKARAARKESSAPPPQKAKKRKKRSN